MAQSVKVTSRVKVLVGVLVMFLAGLQEIESLQTEFDPKCDDIDPFARIKCGTLEPPMTKDDCEALGCCFNNRVMGAVSCFYLKGGCSAVLPFSRVQCGSPDMTRASCEAQGCCYDDNLMNTPFCYRKIHEKKK